MADACGRRALWLVCSLVCRSLGVSVRHWKVTLREVQTLLPCPFKKCTIFSKIEMLMPLAVYTLLPVAQLSATGGQFLWRII